MAKRRTRKQKEMAKHTFTISRSPLASEAKKTASEAGVKRQFKEDSSLPKLQNSKNESLESTAITENLASIKRDIVKSLILASLILTSEIVLYLFWKV